MRAVLAAAMLTLPHCASLKPLPAQTLSCLETSAPELLAGAGTAIATHEDEESIEGEAVNIAIPIIICEAMAIIQDETHAKAVAAAVGTDAATVQAHAKTYVASKGISPTE